MTCGDAVSIAPRPPRGRPAQTAGYQLFGHRSGAATHRPSHAGGAGSADRIRTGVLAILETARDYPCATASPAAIVVPSGSRAVCASPFSFVALAGSLSYGHTSRYEAPGGCWRVKADVVVAVPRCCTPTPTWWSRHPARWRSIISRQRRAGRKRERGRSQSRVRDPCWSSPGRLVFTSAVGTELDSANVRRKFRKVLTGAAQMPGVDLTPHEWTTRETRASFVSILSDETSRSKRSPGWWTTPAPPSEEVYRKQIRAVIQTGATVMDGIFGTPAPPER